MKKFLFSLAGVSMAFSAISGVSIPTDYSHLEYSSGSVLMCKSDFCAMKIDLNDSKLKFNRLTDSNKNNQYGHNLYKRKDQHDFWNDYATSKTFGFINGQFFNNSITHQYNTPITFAVKGDGVVYQDINDGNRKLYSLLQKDGKYYLKYGYSKTDLNNFQDLFVAWDISEKTSSSDGTSKDNRTYIGGIPKNSSCNAKKSKCELSSIIFLFAKNKTISDSVTELSRFNVSYSNMVRLDGGGSAQFITRNHDFHEGWNARNLPHMIEILDKGCSFYS
ncbi:MAG: hypothetical protein GY828_06195 [Candidatus Gracilibacteria bacterium]|nr:hypothetical protein [Candidatus Gracilibacteria bacterium]